MPTMRLKEFIFLLAFLLSQCSPLFASPSPFSDKYDLLIKRDVRRYMPGVDPLLFKAQLIQESALKPDAVSPVGAMGLAQLMPGTVKDSSRALGYQVNPYNPRHAIQAGARYMSYLRGQWRWERPERDKHSLALASYNAGLGHILAAQKHCNNATLYSDIIACLPRVTGRHAEETLNYVPRIWAIYKRLANES